jgi:hypothetical protein
MTKPSDLRIPRVPVGSEKLIQEGAVSYVQATIAMNQFKKIVLDVCEDLAKGHLEGINKMMGTNFTEEDVRHYPQKGKLLDTEDPWMYVSFNLNDVVYFSIGLYWKPQDGSYQLHAITTIWFSDQKLFQKARQKFDERRDLKFTSFPYKDKDKYITLSEAIPEGQTTAFPEKLQTVLEEFLQGWEKIGGLKNLMGNRLKAR